MRRYKPRNAKSEIVIRFDDHNLPRVQLKHITEDQLHSSGLFLQQIARNYTTHLPAKRHRTVHRPSIRRAIVTFFNALTFSLVEHCRFINRMSQHVSCNYKEV